MNYFSGDVCCCSALSGLRIGLRVVCSITAVMQGCELMCWRNDAGMALAGSVIMQYWMVGMCSRTWQEGGIPLPCSAIC